jgi:hypothetical protein
LTRGAPAAHVEDELRCLRRLFEEHRDAQIREVAAWLNGQDNTLH